MSSKKFNFFAIALFQNLKVGVAKVTATSQGLLSAMLRIVGNEKVRRLVVVTMFREYWSNINVV